jgi:predicted nucleic-acid-binding protein
VETFDTNVLVRVVYQDEPSQVERARRAWQAAVNGGGAFLTITVLVELAWVLRTAAKLDRATIAQALRRLCDAEGVTVEAEPRVRRALGLFEAGRADFSDYVLLETAEEAGALPVVTFDRDFAGETRVKLA